MDENKPAESLEQVQNMTDLEWQRHQLQKKAKLDAEFNRRNQEDDELSQKGVEGLQHDETYTTKDWSRDKRED
jgi:hypothetical protein